MVHCLKVYVTFVVSELMSHFVGHPVVPLREIMALLNVRYVR
jgi:hypothetical protein